MIQGEGELEQALRHRAKEALRARYGALRSAIGPDSRAVRDERVCVRVLDLPDFERASVVGAYVALGSETSPAGVVRTALERGKGVALPWMDWAQDRVVMRLYDGEAELEESGLGFLQPPDSAPAADPAAVDLVLVPALALDERGHRLGYGKGFYDRLLPELENGVRVGLGYDFQVVSELPNTAGDERLDVVVTDARLIRIERRGSEQA